MTNGKGIAKREGFALAIPDIEELRTVIEANIGPAGISEFDLDRVTVPTGGGLSWVIETLDGPVEKKELTGVIVAWKDVRAYWRRPFGGGDGKVPPDCYSDDSLTGHGDPGGDCPSCPYAQFGSKVNAQTGEVMAGQACKQMRALFVIQAGSTMPTVLAIPPTSLKPMRNYFLRLAAQRLPYWAVVTAFGLTRDKSQGGITYSKVAPALAERLTSEQAQQMAVLAQTFAPIVRRVIIDTTAARAAE